MAKSWKRHMDSKFNFTFFASNFLSSARCFLQLKILKLRIDLFKGVEENMKHSFMLACHVLFTLRCIKHLKVICQGICIQGQQINRPWWWYSGQRSRLLFQRSEFASWWLLNVYYCTQRRKQQERGRVWPTFWIKKDKNTSQLVLKLKTTFHYC